MARIALTYDMPLGADEGLHGIAGIVRHHAADIVRSPSEVVDGRPRFGIEVDEDAGRRFARAS
jgi:hypothetical protein